MLVGCGLLGRGHGLTHHNADCMFLRVGCGLLGSGRCLSAQPSPTQKGEIMPLS
jgi:hypothetical protein